MKKYLGIFIILFIAMVPAMVNAAEKSSDKMILEWKTEKIWLSNNELCVSGEFTNRRSDLTITQLNDFVTTITFVRSDGSTDKFAGKPQKMPILKIKANGTQKVTFNLGVFESEVGKWVTNESYVFSYVSGVRW